MFATTWFSKATDALRNLPAQDKLLAPPIIPVFSIRITFAPSSAAATAAETPEAPAPITITSASSFSVLPSPSFLATFSIAF